MSVNAWKPEIGELANFSLHDSDKISDKLVASKLGKVIILTVIGLCDTTLTYNEAKKYLAFETPPTHTHTQCQYEVL